MHITRHAIERYRKRWARGLTDAEAEHELRELAGRASRLRERTVCGDEMWVVDGILFAVRRDPGRSEPVLVTVLPPASRESGPSLLEEEHEILLQHLAEKADFEARRAEGRRARLAAESLNCERCGQEAEWYSQRFAQRWCGTCRKHQESLFETSKRGSDRPGKIRSIQYYRETILPRRIAIDNQSRTR